MAVRVSLEDQRAVLQNQQSVERVPLGVLERRVEIYWRFPKS